MEFCKQHWNELCAHVRIQGLWECQISDPDEIKMYLRMIQGDIRNGDDASLFDALLAAQYLVLQKYYELYGVATLIEEAQAEIEEGKPAAAPLCQMCEHEKLHPGGPARWMLDCVSNVRRSAINHGFIRPDTMQ